MLIRPLATIDECHRAAALERDIWGYTAPDEVTPAAVLIVSIRRGGIVLGAFDGERMVGFVHSAPAVKESRVTQWSHALGVLASERGKGVGLQLKVEQRKKALEQGVDLIEWTFDPLQALNARFNFGTLGVVVSEYIENAYGASSSPMHGEMATDRFVAEWHLTRPHVERRLSSGGRPLIRDHSLTTAAVVNPAAMRGGRLGPGVADLDIDARRVLVEVPASPSPKDGELTRAWRHHTREVFQAYLSRQYRVVDFFLSTGAGRGQYLLAAAE